MAEDHFNEPRDIGYTKENKEIYKEWTKREASGIFAGITQADLFFFAVAVGANRKKKKEIKSSKSKDIPTSALSDSQKWGILSTVVAEKNDLLVLKDERPIYEEAEKFANEGIEIIKSHIEKNGLNYPKFLEVELKQILEKSK